MSNRLRFGLIIIVIYFGWLPKCSAEGVLIAWGGGRDVVGVTKEAFEDAKKLPPDEVAKRNLAVKSWGDAYLLLVAASQHKAEKTLQESLVGQLTDQTNCNLKSTSRLIIWERISSGEILFEGKGLCVADDLFTVAGRANWLLRNLTAKNFGYVRPKSSKEYLNALKQSWEESLAGEEVAEYKPPFEV
jgi:hypothetical protein